ncbi:hypothetical protein B5X24_HaOG209041 [Helicoverpa armigera]|uniref:Uncharacterized protein n=1 Tax=Helicoverpa armigera TaxID=29058 RepID=A0A2W1BIW2_HELAM|nr:hypothetical protein B5X24_HaOG209041 [Helicoverpa armigera]
MTILLYDYYDLEEKSSKQLSVWKAWHLILYVCAAVFGITNYVFLQNTMQLVDGNCVLFPRQLEFRVVELPEAADPQNYNEYHDLTKNATDDAQGNGPFQNDDSGKVKRETPDNDTAVTETLAGDSEIFTENKTHRLVLDVSRTLFETNNDCDFAEYTPLMSMIFAAVWITMFTMCPRGGRARAGLPQPWRILAPALLFALIMVGVTGHSFTLTNGGLHAFCAAFYDVSNSTTCSSADPFLELGWNATWGFSSRAAATRAASAGVLASWACAAALLLARCLAAPDFVLRRTDVYLTKDPQQKVIPHLLKSQKYHQRSNQSSPSKRDNASMRSEPTVTTELVTASVEQGQDSVPTSLIVTPVKTPRDTEDIEMTYTSQERINKQE